MSEMSVFNRLNTINVNGHTEKKNGLTYLSWAWAWAEVKKLYPDATYTIYERDTEFGPVNYFTDGRTCWVKTGVTIQGLEHIEELPVMDFKNKSIPYEAVNSMDVNKAIQRSLTKACARHGLGLYIYAGEDLPESDSGKDADGVKDEDLAFPIDRDGRPIHAIPAFDVKAAVKAFNEKHKLEMNDFVALYDACCNSKKLKRSPSTSWTKEEFETIAKVLENELK